MEFGAFYDKLLRIHIILGGCLHLLWNPQDRHTKIRYHNVRKHSQRQASIRIPCQFNVRTTRVRPIRRAICSKCLFLSLVLLWVWFDLNNYFILNFNNKFGPSSQAFDPPPAIFNVAMSLKTTQVTNMVNIGLGWRGTHSDFCQGKKGGTSSNYGNSC